MSVQHVMPSLLQSITLEITLKFTLMCIHFHVDSVKKDLKQQVNVKHMNDCTLELSHIHVLFVEKVFHSQAV